MSSSTVCKDDKVLRFCFAKKKNAGAGGREIEQVVTGYLNI